MATKIKIPAPPGSVLNPINDFDDVAEWIADPPPTRPLAEAIGTAGQNVCRFVGSSPAAALATFSLGAGQMALLCKPYWDSEGYDPPVEIPPPFSGGKCEVSYQIFSHLRNPITGVPTTPSPVLVATRTGPLSYARLDPAPTGCGGGGFGEASLSIVSPGGMFGPVSIHGAGCVLFRQLISLSVVRVDGLPDDCGTQEPEGIEPGENPPPANDPFPPGQEPGVDPDGQPFFFVPPISPPFPGAPDFDVPDPFSELPPGGEGGEGSPIVEGEPVEGTDPEGEADEGSEIYALVVTLTTVPPFARQIEPGLYVSPCRIFLGTDFGLDLDEAGRALRSGQAVFAETDGLTKWRVSASVGFTVSVTPYYRTKKS